MFHAKFEAIPEDRWCTIFFEKLNGQRCVLGHLGENSVFASDLISRDAKNLEMLLAPYVEDENTHKLSACVLINDWGCEQFQQPTPKARILAALTDIIRK